MKEIIANSITHGVGFLLSILGFIILIYSSLASSSICIVSCIIYGSSLVILYFVSTLYHSLSHLKILQKLDHISIYLLIAGSYMPISLVILKGALGWTIFGLEWGLCLAGIIFKILFGARFSAASILFYLAMGWVAIFAIKPLVSHLSFEGILWILLGGVFYTVGVLFYALDKKIPYFHALWHLFVLAGSVCHYFMILRSVIPYG